MFININLVIMKTFIRWQGNKSKHLNKFIDNIPEFSGRYIEPFLGSGALFLKLEPKQWIINDLNQDLINIWTNVKNEPKEIIKQFKQFGKRFVCLSKENKLSYCKDITSKIETLTYDVKRASYYLLMTYSCYSGSIIFHNTFKFKGINLNILAKNQYSFLEDCYFANLYKVNQFLNDTNGKIYNKSYEYILNKAKEGDFVFLDPPYIESHDYNFNYNKDEQLDDNFLKNLYIEVKKLDAKRVKWLMTQADTKQIRNLFKEYKTKTFKVYRVGSRSYVNELIIMNY